MCNRNKLENEHKRQSLIIILQYCSNRAFDRNVGAYYSLKEKSQLLEKAAQILKKILDLKIQTVLTDKDL